MRFSFDDFESAIKNSNKITETDIMTEAKTLASKKLLEF